jgi:hypothetical protein
LNQVPPQYTLLFELTCVVLVHEAYFVTVKMKLYNLRIELLIVMKVSVLFWVVMLSEADTNIGETYCLDLQD